MIREEHEPSDKCSPDLETPRKEEEEELGDKCSPDLETPRTQLGDKCSRNSDTPLKEELCENASDKCSPPDLLTLKEEELCEKSWWMTSLFPLTGYTLKDSAGRLYCDAGIIQKRLEYARTYMDFEWEKENAVFVGGYVVRVGRFTVRLTSGVSRTGVFDIGIRSSFACNSIAGAYLNEVLKPLLAEDGPCHGGNITLVHCAPLPATTRSWLADQVNAVINLPGCAHDLGIMENIWCCFKDELASLSSMRPTSKAELIEMINEVWASVQRIHTDSLLYDLYESLGKRLRLCVKGNGALLYR